MRRGGREKGKEDGRGVGEKGEKDGRREKMVGKGRREGRRKKKERERKGEILWENTEAPNTKSK